MPSMLCGCGRKKKKEKNSPDHSPPYYPSGDALIDHPEDLLHSQVASHTGSRQVDIFDDLNGSFDVPSGSYHPRLEEQRHSKALHRSRQHTSGNVFSFTDVPQQSHDNSPEHTNVSDIYAVPHKVKSCLKGGTQFSSTFVGSSSHKPVSQLSTGSMLTSKSSDVCSNHSPSVKSSTTVPTLSGLPPHIPVKIEKLIHHCCLGRRVERAGLGRNEIEIKR